MSKLVIVAIPEPDDLVWQVSTEPVPHLTLLYLGESGEVSNVFQILQFLQHAAQTTLHRFSLEVDRRGKLGEDEADVVFFEGSWDLPDLKRFRDALLQNDNIKKAYLSTEQFPDWLPHLTLGYPKTPAKELKDGRRIYSVSFDRVALWVDDYAGPEFPLKRYEYPEVAMSQEAGKAAVDDILAHYGVKGMRWGHRKSSGGGTATSSKVKKAKEPRPPAHEDATAAKTAVGKAKKGGLDALSNQELQAVAQRLELERKVSTLAGDDLKSNGQLFVEAIMAASTASQPRKR